VLFAMGPCPQRAEAGGGLAAATRPTAPPPNWEGWVLANTLMYIVECLLVAKKRQFVVETIVGRW